MPEYTLRMFKEDSLIEYGELTAVIAGHEERLQDSDCAIERRKLRRQLRNCMRRLDELADAILGDEESTNAST